MKQLLIEADGGCRPLNHINESTPYWRKMNSLDYCTQGSCKRAAGEGKEYKTILYMTIRPSGPNATTDDTAVGIQWGKVTLKAVLKLTLVFGRTH